LDEHLSGVSTRSDARELPDGGYRKRSQGTAKQATGRRIGEGWCRRRQSNKRGGGFTSIKWWGSCVLSAT
jgi:hypothetical protein